MSQNPYVPTTGFAQSSYKDQMGTALPGMLAFTSDYNNVNSFPVSASQASTGLEAGLVVASEALASENGVREGILPYSVITKAQATIADFKPFGVSVRNQQMNTNVNGKACWFAGQMASVLDLKRVGGRVWMQVATGGTANVGDDVYAIAKGDKVLGSVTNTAGASGSEDAVQVPNAIFLSSVVDGMALVEFSKFA